MGRVQSHTHTQFACLVSTRAFHPVTPGSAPFFVNTFFSHSVSAPSSTLHHVKKQYVNCVNLFLLFPCCKLLSVSSLCMISGARFSSVEQIKIKWKSLSQGASHSMTSAWENVSFFPIILWNLTVQFTWLHHSIPSSPSHLHSPFISSSSSARDGSTALLFYATRQFAEGLWALFDSDDEIEMLPKVWSSLLLSEDSSYHSS